jgi:hypothetical protein
MLLRFRLAPLLYQRPHKVKAPIGENGTPALYSRKGKNK